MLKKRLFFACICVCVSLLLVESSFAEAYTQWQLPEGAFARLGKGWGTDFDFSPDSSHLVVATSIGIWIYETATYREVALITEHAVVDVIKFSPDGKTIAGANLYPLNPNSQFVRFWDAETGRHKHTVNHTPSVVSSMAFSPDSTLLATGCGDSNVRFWDAETGRHTQTLTGHTDRVLSVAFSPDGKTLASRSQDRTLRLWDAETGRHKHTVNHIRDFAFSPDGKNIATSIKRTYSDVHFWDVSTGKNTQTLDVYKGTRAFVDCLVFSPDGETLVMGGSDSSIRFWDTKTGRHTQTLWEHTGPIERVVFSRDGKTLLCYGRECLSLWDAKTGFLKQVLRKQVLGHLSRLHRVALSPDGKTVMTQAYRDASVRLWDVSRREHIRTLTGHTRAFNSVIFSPDGKTVATRSDDGKTRLWETPTVKHKHTLTHDGYILSEDRDTSMAFSPDGKTLATGRDDETLRLWDVNTGEHIRTLTGHTETLHSVMFSPDGKTLTTGSYDGTLRLWETETGRHRHTLMLSADPSLFYNVMFSPDGKRFVAGSHDGTLRVWGANTGIHTHTLTGHTARITDIAFSPESRTLATACAHGTLRLWDVGTGEQIRTLFLDGDADTNIFFSVAFSPDGKRLATAIRSDDYYAVQFWDVKTGKRTHTFTGHTAEIYSVAFSPDGKRLATASADGTVLLWDVPRTLVIYEH